MILVDSSVWIDFLRGHATPQSLKLKQLIGDVEIAVGDLILTEVLQGCHRVREFRDTQQVLNHFNIIELGGYEVALQAARNHLYLRSLGYTIRKTIDTIIATRSIMSNHRLLHSDRDFLPFEKHLGLRTVI